MISLTEADHERYLSRRKYWLDEQSRRAEGRAEGHAEGRTEGRAEGVVIGRIQVLESLLGLAPSLIEQFDARSVDELLRVEAELQAKLHLARS
ncbi:MAG: hypothetical protein NT013_19005 [Planctomycetia bacterium]|nr:hypothetical protein [Planctomycetia bacterium]